MWQYDHSEFPPAPKLEVQNFAAGVPPRTVSSSAKLDTGASTTVIPEEFVEWLDLQPHDST